MKSVFCFCLALASAPALAEGWYVDLGYGGAHAEHNESDLEGSDQYMRASLGYERPDDISIEGGYLDAGEATDGLIAASTDGVFLAMKGTVRSDQFVWYGRAGAFKWSGEVCRAGVCDNEGDLDVLLGLGVSFALGPGALNAEVNFVQLDDDVNVTMTGVSYSFFFGGR